MSIIYTQFQRELHEAQVQGMQIILNDESPNWAVCSDAEANECRIRAKYSYDLGKRALFTAYADMYEAASKSSRTCSDYDEAQFYEVRGKVMGLEIGLSKSTI